MPEIKMTDAEIEARMDELANLERKTICEILNIINHAFFQKTYATSGFSGLYGWLTKKFKYSAGSAMRRIHAASLLRQLPHIEETLKAGDLNLTNLSRAAQYFEAEEKRLGEKLSIQAKSEVVAKLEKKTTEQARRLLEETYPMAKPNRPGFTPLKDGLSRIELDLSPTGRLDFERAKELLSHALPKASWSEIAERVFRDFIARNDPMEKPVRKGQIMITTTTGGRISKGLRDRILQRDSACCVKCGSRHQVEVDHIIPRALGGTNAPENLRTLCSTHNIHAAEIALGVSWANSWRKQAEAHFAAESGGPSATETAMTDL